jgi:predicted RNase H-like HicB family nuclease
MRGAHAVRPIRVNIYYSPSAHSFWANSPDLNGLAASGKTRAEVEREAMWAAETLLDIAGIQEKPELTFQDAEFQVE